MATHTTRFNLFDPQECWDGSGNQPDRSFNVAILIAELVIPSSSQSLPLAQMRTRVTTAGASSRPGGQPGGYSHSFFRANAILFAIGNGGTIGPDLQPTSGNRLDYAEHIRTEALSQNTSMDLVLYTFVKLQRNGSPSLTFVECKFHIRVTGNANGGFIDQSPAPVVRYSPCAGLIPTP